MINPEFVYITGYVFIGIFWMLGLLKRLQNDKIIKHLKVVAIGILLLGLFFKNKNIVIESGGYASIFYIGPIIYILVYSYLRKRFIQNFNMEPTYYWISWYDPEEGRKQTWNDVIVFILPIILSTVIPLTIGLYAKG